MSVLVLAPHLIVNGTANTCYLGTVDGLYHNI